VLPLNEQAQEDMQWLLTELRSSGAEAALLESRFIDGMSDRDVEELFRAARDTDYRELLDELEAAAAEMPDNVTDAAARDPALRMLARARKRFAEIEAIDYFSADGHSAVEGALRDLSARTKAGSGTRPAAALSGRSRLEELQGRVWVTRRGVRVDRIASAWLIGSRIDAGAEFKFVSGQDYVPEEGQLRFDMFEAEYTHEGDRCTFEVLARLVDEHDTALRCIGEIVHDIDLKDDKFGRPETEGVANLLEGIVAGTDDDNERIRRGGAMFEDLYRFFRGSAG